METNCKNCEVELKPEFDYCPKCSQKARLHRLSMHEVFHEGVHYFTHADKGLLQLVRDLVLKGGVVAKEYVEGRRKKYFSPLNFFLLIAALNLFAVNADEKSDRPDVARENAANVASIKDPTERIKYQKMYERQIEAVEYIRHHSNKTVLVMLPIMTFIFWLFYRRSGFNFTEHLIAGMYMYGFCTLVFASLALINLIFKVDINFVYGISLTFQLFYFARFYYRFMGDCKPVRAFFASLMAICSVFVLNGLVVSLYMTGVFGG